MKKTILILVAAFFLGISVNAQDVITLKNGDEIQALVQEIGIDEVKYKRFDNPDGPNYILRKSEVFMIRYANGSRDVFADNTQQPISTTTSVSSQSVQPTVQNQMQSQDEMFLVSIGKGRVNNMNGKRLNPNEVRTLMKEDQNALRTYNRGISNRRAGNALSIPGWIAFGAGMTCFIANASDGFDDPDLLGAQLVCLVVQLGFHIPTAILRGSGDRKIASAVGMYNNSALQRQNQNLSLNFGITSSGGIGLTLNF